MMKRECLQIGFVIAATLLLVSSASPQGRPVLEKIVISYPSRSLTSFLIPELARQRGFFHREGLDAHLIYVRGGIDIKALITGDVDYMAGSTTATSAYVAGVPIRLILNYISRVEHVVVAQPKYRTFNDLKGQVIGSLNPGGLMDLLLRQIISKNGLNPDRDVILVNMGGTPERYTSLKSGSVAATILGSPYSFRAEKEGYRKIAAAADYVEAAGTGIVVRSDRISKQPDQIKRFIRASLRAMAQIRGSRQETIQFIMREFSMEREIATMAYDQLVQIMSRDGNFPLSGVQFMVDIARRAQKVQKEIAASDLVDSTLLEDARKELGLVR